MGMYAQSLRATPMGPGLRTAKTRVQRAFLEFSSLVFYAMPRCFVHDFTGALIWLLAVKFLISSVTSDSSRPVLASVFGDVMHID